MKLSGVSVALLIILIMIVLQSIGGYLQIQDYRKAVRRMRHLGNLGMGQKRGKLLNGHVAIVACDSNGIITGCEVLDGIGVLSRFHKKETFKAASTPSWISRKVWKKSSGSASRDTSGLSKRSR